MKIAVCGLWHLGTVTAACLAAAGHEVIGYDNDAVRLAMLTIGKLPVSEPGLEDLTKRGMTEGKLRFTDNARDALENAELVWICWDTPVDDNDVADVESVKQKIVDLMPHFTYRSTVAISSQLPVGTTAWIEKRYNEVYKGSVGFAYVPENLRLGNAIDRFNDQGRQVIVGTREHGSGWIHEQRIMDAISAHRVRGGNFLTMSPESAEMCKHAINAFLATQIALTNEIAVICEEVGADARDVEAALRSEPRIGPKAYVKAGAAFAGGTLARDLNYLMQNGGQIAQAVFDENNAHEQWTMRKLIERLAPSPVTMFRGKTIAVWGTTYKSETNTLRRSAVIRMINALRMSYGATVNLPEETKATLDGADALVIGNEHPLYREVSADEIVRLMRRPLVIDPSGWLNITDPRIEYVVVGRSTGHGKA